MERNKCRIALVSDNCPFHPLPDKRSWLTLTASPDTCYFDLLVREYNLIFSTSQSRYHSALSGSLLQKNMPNILSKSSTLSILALYRSIFCKSFILSQRCAPAWSTRRQKRQRKQNYNEESTFHPQEEEQPHANQPHENQPHVPETILVYVLLIHVHVYNRLKVNPKGIWCYIHRSRVFLSMDTTSNFEYGKYFIA